MAEQMLMIDLISPCPRRMCNEGKGSVDTQRAIDRRAGRASASGRRATSLPWRPLPPGRRSPDTPRPGHSLNQGQERPTPAGLLARRSSPVARLPGRICPVAVPAMAETRATRSLLTVAGTAMALAAPTRGRTIFPIKPMTGTSAIFYGHLASPRPRHSADGTPLAIEHKAASLFAISRGRSW